MNSATTNRRLAAIMVADVVGYSRMMEADEAGTLAALKERRKAILEPVVKAHGGRIVKLMGDGALVEFASAVNAVQGAIELQKQMVEANNGVPDDRHVVLRIGINLGDVIGEGSDIYGEGVNIAARLEPLAEPGGIVVSGAVHDQVRGRIGVNLESMGEQQLKNIAQAMRVYAFGGREQGGPKGVMLTLPDRPSIAVLPFQNMSGDAEQEYFADGMVEEVITALSRVRWLFVIARNSSFTYKGRNIDVKQIGRELGVRYVLEGSVRKAGTRIRITGQLIDAATGAHLWAERFDGGLEDAFDLQDQVTASVVGAISPKLEQAEIERATRKPTENLDAYDYFLRGMAALHRWTREPVEEALALFSKAINRDPSFASAHGVAAWCYVLRKANGWMADREQEIVTVRQLALKATELGKDDAVALSRAGHALAFVAGELDSGIELIDRALMLNPNLASGWLFSGWVRANLGEPELALDHLTQALRLSPFDPLMFGIQNGRAMAHFIAGRDIEALSWAEKSLLERPDYLPSLRFGAAANALAGRMGEARRLVARMRLLDPELRISNLADSVALRRPQDLVRLADGLRKAGLPE